MISRFALIVAAVGMLCLAAHTHAWDNPLIKKGHVGTELVETTPFVFNDRLYLLENWRGGMTVKSPRKDNTIDEIWIRDVEDDRYVGRVAQYHSLSSAFVHEGRIYVFALPNDHIGGNKIHMFTSEDMTTWTEPVVVVEGKPGEHFYNPTVCRGDGKFVMLVETNDPTWPTFTFRYYTNENIDDAKGWKAVPRGLYGVHKYAGGPALYYEGGWYYTLYLEAGPGWQFSTRIARSKNLVHWIEAPRDRVFIPMDPSIVTTFTGKPVKECNASDAEVTYWKGKTIAYFTGGDQNTTADLQRAEFDGTPRQLFEAFFADVPAPVDENGRPEITKIGTIGFDIVEIQPIVFNGVLYRFESVRGHARQNTIGKPHFQFVEVATDVRTPPFAEGHDLGSVFVEGDTMYVFGTPGWGASTVNVFWSKDLIHWESTVGLTTENWALFNTSVCKAGDRYIMAFEVGDPPEIAGSRFTNRFAESKDLKTWTILPEPAVFTKDKYSACPTIRYVDDWFYMVYLEATGHYQFNPYLVRSRDLATWEASPLNPLIKFEDADKRIGTTTYTDEQKQEIAKAMNRNNSDWDYCEVDGYLLINYSWGDQAGHEFLAEAIYGGTLKQFLTGFFPETKGGTPTP